MSYQKFDCSALNIKPLNERIHDIILDQVLIDVDGEKIYIAGDTDLTAEARQVRCDIALVPIGGTYTMDASVLVNGFRQAMGDILAE